MQAFLGRAHISLSLYNPNADRNFEQMVTVWDGSSLSKIEYIFTYLLFGLGIQFWAAWDVAALLSRM